MKRLCTSGVIALALLASSLVSPGEVQSKSTINFNTAECVGGYFWVSAGANSKDSQFSVQVHDCRNMWEGKVEIVYPDGTTYEILPWQDQSSQFWGWTRLMDEGVIFPLTQAGNYELRVEGIGCVDYDWVEGVFTCINGTVYWIYGHYMSPMADGSPIPLAKPTSPSVTEIVDGRATLTWTGGPGEYQVVMRKRKANGRLQAQRIKCSASLEVQATASCELVGMSEGRWRIKITRKFGEQTSIRIRTIFVSKSVNSE